MLNAMSVSSLNGVDSSSSGHLDVTVLNNQVFPILSLTFLLSFSVRSLSDFNDLYVRLQMDRQQVKIKKAGTDNNSALNNETANPIDPISNDSSWSCGN